MKVAMLAYWLHAFFHESCDVFPSALGRRAGGGRAGVAARHDHRAAAKAARPSARVIAGALRHDRATLALPPPGGDRASRGGRDI